MNEMEILERIKILENIQEKMESELKSLQDLLNDLELKARGLK